MRSTRPATLEVLRCFWHSHSLLCQLNYGRQQALQHRREATKGRVCAGLNSGRPHHFRSRPDPVQASLAGWAPSRDTIAIGNWVDAVEGERGRRRRGGVESIVVATHTPTSDSQPQSLQPPRHHPFLSDSVCNYSHFASNTNTRGANLQEEGSGLDHVETPPLRHA